MSGLDEKAVDAAWCRAVGHKKLGMAATVVTLMRPDFEDAIRAYLSAVGQKAGTVEDRNVENSGYYYQHTPISVASAALIPAPSVAEAAEPVTRPSVLTIVSEALSDATDVLKAVHDWQAGSEILPIDLWTQVRDFLRKAGRI